MPHRSAPPPVVPSGPGPPAAPPPLTPQDADRVSLGSFAHGWHVEIETDDLPAEVSRLEALGATRHRDMGSFWQTLDPAGLVFCVVGVQTGEEFEKYAVTWP